MRFSVIIFKAYTMTTTTRTILMATIMNRSRFAYSENARVFVAVREILLNKFFNDFYYTR